MKLRAQQPLRRGCKRKCSPPDRRTWCLALPARRSSTLFRPLEPVAFMGHCVITFPGREQVHAGPEGKLS